MIIKRYRVNSMNEAVTRIRYELGKDAIIVSQRKIRKNGFLGFFSKKILEVTAAVDREKNDTPSDMQEGIEAIKKIMNNSVKEDKSKSSNVTVKKPEVLSEAMDTENSKVSKSLYNTALLNKNNEELIKEVQEMRNMLSDMMDISISGTSVKSKIQLRLENSDLDKKVIETITNKMKNMEENENEEEKLKAVLGDMIKVSEVLLENVVVFVGPTGVGKTTTIAKLAGRLALIEKKKVGLITIDTYRIGAVEQLKTYADIMNIPFKVVLTIKDMQQVIESMKDCDVILIDTTGRSSKNTMQISELRAFIEKIGTSNINLVMSCTTKNKDIDVIVNGYKLLNYNNIIITKLDETSTYGSIVNILYNAQKPVSFVTTGQNVPDDIKVLSSRELINLVLGEDCV
jgi:flagellar biosynthesis protein FlhF